ncbi:hypothetical protein Droror1_Dr00026371 [Drosera rotundifolia]
MVPCNLIPFGSLLCKLLNYQQEKINKSNVHVPLNLIRPHRHQQSLRHINRALDPFHSAKIQPNILPSHPPKNRAKNQMTTPTTDSPGGATTTLLDIDPDIIRTHILSRLEGPDLAALSSVSKNIHQLATSQDLWSSIISTTWPSTNDPVLRGVIESFPNGPFSFFSHAFPLLDPNNNNTNNNLVTRSSTDGRDHRQSKIKRVISAVDVSYRGKNIFSKVQGTETSTGWFRSTPFRIDLLEPKDSVPTTPTRKNVADEETCRDLYNDMSLSWIMIDPVAKRVVNLSSFRPVWVQRRWWTGEVVVRFVTIVLGRGNEHVMFCIEVTCAGGGAGEGEGEGEEREEELHVREVSMWVEDTMGAHLNGEDSLVTLKKGFGGKRVKRGRKVEEEVKWRYEEFLEVRRLRKERRLRREGRKDLLCVSSGVSFFMAFFMLLVWNRY